MTDDVSAQYLKLTAYFGERLRSEHRFTADALLDLYDEAAVATSVVLRGIAGFGPRHHWRSDEQLSLSEDPPVAIAAVDTADKIGGLAPRALAMTGRGLITLERAQLAGPSGRLQLPDWAKLTVYLGRQHRIGDRPGYQVICDVLHRRGFLGATAFIGVDGTAHGQRRRARFFSRNVDVPAMIIGVGTGPQVQATIAELDGVLTQPLLTVERIQVCKRDGHLLSAPAALPATDDGGRPLWQKLMVHTSEATLSEDGAPIHRAIIRRLRDARAANGATVLRGAWGFHGDHRPHGDRFLQFGRQVPVATIVVDAPENIRACFDVVDALTGQHGLVTSELVPALVSVDGGRPRGGLDLARVHGPGG